MKYIIENSTGGNARILAFQGDGTYKPIAQLFGEQGLEEGKLLVERANQDGAPKASY